MPKVWSTISSRRDKGFSLVEILLAVTIFGMLSTAIIGAIIYGRTSTADAGDRTRANYIAEEGTEAVRNIRNAGFANLVDGTYGLVKSSGVWTLSGSSDVTDIFTRSVTIATSSTNHKTVTSHVSWSGAGGSGSTDVVTEFTNWIASLVKSWSSPSQYSSTDLSGTIAGYKVATYGSYAYLVRNSSTGPNFFVIDISTPTAPTVVGSMTLAGTPTNVATSTTGGNYVYVSNSSSSAELQIVKVTTPTAPTLAGTYNASGNAGANALYVVGTTVYLVRSANGGNDEFVIVNAATPTAPSRSIGYGLNISMYGVYVNGNSVYIATGSSTQEIISIGTTLAPFLLTLDWSVNLPGTTAATTIIGNGTRLVVGQGTTLYSLDASASGAPPISGTLTIPGTILSTSFDTVHNYVDVGTNYATGEFQVVNLTAPATPSLLSSVDLTGSQSLNGVAYNSTYDVAVGASSNTAQEFPVFGPN